MSCGTQSCMNGVKTIAATCDGAGNCPTQTVNCSPPTCNTGNTDCASTCSMDGDCSSTPATPYCDHGGCTAHKPIGRTCSGTSECNSGFCIDGVCCNQACTGECQACDITDATNNVTPGTCAPVTSGSPHNVPASGRTACASGNVTCAGSCAAGQTLTCTYPTVQCGGGTCSNGMVTAAVDCNNGSCPGTTSKPCANNMACNGNICFTGTCSSDAQCAAGYFCASDGSCQAVLAQGAQCPNSDCFGGTACKQCATGNCVDGYCCDSACGGQCQACNLNGTTGVTGSKPGTCSTVVAGGAPVVGDTPSRTACGGTTPCTGTCNGTDGTACHFSTATCSSQTCNGNVVTFASTCNNGKCTAPNPATQTCSGTCSPSTGAAHLLLPF